MLIQLFRKECKANRFPAQQHFKCASPWTLVFPTQTCLCMISNIYWSSLHLCLERWSHPRYQRQDLVLVCTCRICTYVYTHVLRHTFAILKQKHTFYLHEKTHKNKHMYCPHSHICMKYLHVCMQYMHACKVCTNLSFLYVCSLWSAECMQVCVCLIFSLWSSGECLSHFDPFLSHSCATEAFIRNRVIHI